MTINKIMYAHYRMNKNVNDLTESYSKAEESLSTYKQNVKKHRRKEVIEMVIFMTFIVGMMVVGALIYNTEVPAYI